MGTIYHCYRIDDRYRPPQRHLIYEAASEKEAVKFLKENGGGLYRNILHQFEFFVESHQLLNG